MRMITFFYMFLRDKCKIKNSIAAIVSLYLNTVLWFFIGIIFGSFVLLISNNTLDMTTCLLTGGSALGLAIGYLGGLYKIVNIME